MNNQNYLSIYAKSFSWAGFFLNKETYQKCSDLYTFCRYLDNIADETGDIIYDLFDGVESDLEEKVELKSEKELLIYSYRVAGTVGLMMAKILNVKKESAFKAAIDLGIAMQLTNISRDVIEDKNLNRYYIKSDIKEIKDTLELAETFYRSCFYYI